MKPIRGLVAGLLTVSLLAFGPPVAYADEDVISLLDDSARQLAEGVRRLQADADSSVPKVGAIIPCEDMNGNQNAPFEVIDAAIGANFKVWVLTKFVPSILPETSFPGEIRVGWHNDLPQSEDGLTLIFTVTGGSLGSMEVRLSHNSQTGITGQCGEFLSSTYSFVNDHSNGELTLNFSGADETISCTTTTIKTTNYSIDVDNIWTVAVDFLQGGATVTRTFQVAFGFNHTETLIEGCTITVSTVLKIFKQSYVFDG